MKYRFYIRVYPKLCFDVEIDVKELCYNNIKNMIFSKITESKKEYLNIINDKTNKYSDSDKEICKIYYKGVCDYVYRGFCTDLVFPIVNPDIIDDSYPHKNEKIEMTPNKRIIVLYL